MIILSLLKLSFPELVDDNRINRDDRPGRLSRLAQLSPGRERKRHFGERFSSTKAGFVAP
jgi:hypothetical protein